MANRVYETAIRIAAKISPAFKSETHAAAAAVGRLSTAAQIKGAEAGTERLAHLTTQTKAAEQKLSAAKTALDRLAAAEKAAGGPTKDSARWMAAGAKAVAAAEKEMSKLRAETVATSLALHQQGIDVHRLVSEQNRLAAALAKTQSREALSASASKIGGHASSVVSDVTKIAAAAGVAGAAWTALTKHLVEAGDEISDTATNLALHTTALQEYRFAAERGGSSAEDFDKGFAKFNETTGDALSGNKTAVKSFNALGISMKALRKETPEGRFNLLADALGKIKDPAQRAAAAQNFLGKTSKSMVGFFAEGSAGIAKLRAQAVGILSPADLANASKAKDAMQVAGASIQGVANALGAELLPVATEALEGLSTFVRENKGEIRQWAKEVVGGIRTKAIPALKDIGGKVLDVALAVGGLIDRGAKLVGGFGNLGIAVAAVRLAPLAKSLLDTSAALVTYTVNAIKARAATAALQASGGPGAGATNTGQAIGKAAQAQMLLGAAAVGFAIGTALDEKLGISDQAGKATFTAGGNLEKNTAADRSLFGIGLGTFGLGGAAAALLAINQRNEAIDAASTGVATHAAKLAAIGRGEGGVQVGAIHIAVHGGSGSQGELKQLASDAGEKVRGHLERFADEREANRRRVSFE